VFVAETSRQLAQAFFSVSVAVRFSLFLVLLGVAFWSVKDVQAFGPKKVLWSEIFGSRDFLAVRFDWPIFRRTPTVEVLESVPRRCAAFRAPSGFSAFSKSAVSMISENVQALELVVVPRYPRKRRHRAEIELPEGTEFFGGLWDGKVSISEFFRDAVERLGVSGRGKKRNFSAAPIFFWGGKTEHRFCRLGAFRRGYDEIRGFR